MESQEWKKPEQEEKQPDRYIPLIACVGCGMTRQADAQTCSASPPLMSRCGHTEGHPVKIVATIHVVDGKNQQLLHVAVDTLVKVSPNPVGKGLKA